MAIAGGVEVINKKTRLAIQKELEASEPTTTNWKLATFISVSRPQLLVGCQIARKSYSMHATELVPLHYWGKVLYAWLTTSL